MGGWRYHQPASTAEAVDLLRRYEGEAKVIAGGQSLLILLSEGLLQPRALVALQGIRELDGLAVEDGSLVIGANVTHQQVCQDPIVRGGWPLLARAAGSVATMQVRNRGTLCGSVAHGFPLSDPPAALLALDAEARLAGPDGERVVPLDQLFLGFLETAIAPDELLTHVRVPALPPRTGSAYETLRTRPIDFPVVGAAARVTLAEDGRCSQARLALVGGGATPRRAGAAEAVLQGNLLTPRLVDEAALAAAEEADPAEDLDGSVAYKRRVLRVVVRRVLDRALREAGAAAGEP